MLPSDSYQLTSLHMTIFYLLTLPYYESLKKQKKHKIKVNSYKSS